ncbi:MAG TPA: hypothetical protein VJH75_04635, partial [Patescibacteria group bacterium]|nr:hypothetical protein [Patescibacteria group bacterium]
MHVVTSPDIKVQGVANEQALRALLETKTWEIGLITAAARQPEEAEMYRRWVKNLAQNLRESG